MLIYAAILMPVLFAMAGAAVDLGFWYMGIQKTQRAADSAALAGAAYLPLQKPSGVAAAQQTVTQNEFDGQVVKIDTVPGRPDLMGVRLRTTVNSVFFQFVGIHHATFERVGIAGFREPVRMGSVSNVLGTEPQGAAWTQWSTSPTPEHDFQLMTQNAMNKKSRGARWEATDCTPEWGHPTDLCNPNPEHDTDGLEYTVHVNPGVTGTLAFEVYDGGSHDTLDTYIDCYGPLLDPRLQGVYNATHNPRFDPAVEDACTGDGFGVGNVTSTSPQTTTYTVLGPKQNGVPQPLTECSPATFTPLYGDQAAWLSALTTPSGQYSPYHWYRNWVRICTITIGANHTGGDYTIRVKASEGIAQWNQYSLRAAFVNGSTVDFAKTQKVKVYGDGRMTLEVYKFSKTSFDFPVIRIPPSYAGTDVDFQSFDLGDVGDGSSMTFHLSWSGDVNQSSVRCRYTGPEAPAGVEMGDCFLGDVHATTDSGRVLDFKIHVPSNYSCNYASPTGCWIRMAAAYPPDQERNADTTSWSTDGEGAPLRLYNSAQFPTF